MNSGLLEQSTNIYSHSKELLYIEEFQRQDMLTEQDWQAIRERIGQLASKLSTLGAVVKGPEFFPPIGQDQITEFESTSGLRLPDDFVSFVTTHCGGWNFFWSCFDLMENNQLEDAMPASPFGGNDDSNFICSAKGTLTSCYEELVEEVSGWVDNGNVSPEDFEIVQRCFPLYLCVLGSDFIGLRLDVDPAEIVYLDHEAGFHIETPHILGRGFTDFLKLYTATGCPDLDYTTPLYNESTRQIDPESPAIKPWLEWLDATDLG